MGADVHSVSASPSWARLGMSTAVNMGNRVGNGQPDCIEPVIVVLCDKLCVFVRAWTKKNTNA